mmetsp:Transcript_67759/g.174636  ORF Transcript_67759/g.174636 Transcript_67759/m.174636 type:complete len:285 (+) Transcript_67759:520-1374(+)
MLPSGSRRPCFLGRGAVRGGIGLGTGRLRGSDVLLVVGRFVHAGHAPSGGVGTILEGRVPLEGHLARAGNRVLPAHRLSGGGVLAKMPGEEVTVEVGLLRAGGLHREAIGRLLELLLGHLRVSVRLDRVNPGVPDAVAELLLLAVEDMMGQVCARGRHIKGLAKDPLLHTLLAGLIDAHFLLDVEAHRHLHEAPVQERHARLHAPRHHGLVRAQAVVQVQLLDLAHILLVELLSVRSLVEVEVAAEDLVGALATQHHLHARGPDTPGHQIHRRGGADRGHVKGL